MSTAPMSISLMNGSFRKMSSPVRIGTVVESRICFISSPNCHGTMSSIHARFHFSIARASLMQLLTLMWP